MASGEPDDEDTPLTVGCVECGFAALFRVRRFDQRLWRHTCDLCRDVVVADAIDEILPRPAFGGRAVVIVERLPSPSTKAR